MAMIEYGFLGRGEDGKRKAYTSTHMCCFGSLGTALMKLNDARNRYIPIEGVDWIPGKVIVSCQETAEDFRKWFKRLRKDFPTYRVNGVDHPAPTARYYDVNSRQPGHLNDGKGNGPLKQTPKRSYVIVSFPEGTSNNVLYIGLKFYMKNLMNPDKRAYNHQNGDEKYTMAGLFKKTEQALVMAGFKKPNMKVILAAMSSSSGSHTMGYSWPVGGGNVYKAAFKKFLTEGYECCDFVDTGKFFHIDKGFEIYTPKNSPKGLSGWSKPAERLEGDVLCTVLATNMSSAIERIKEVLK